MHKLSFTLSFLLWITVLYGQSPHGESLKFDCSYCHTTNGWKVDRNSMSFNHDSTSYNLVGQHSLVNCRLCHKSLEFSAVKNECKDCHDDLHENTLGPDCAKCHTPKSWIVENISEIHRQSRFPLTGAHQIVDCTACHKSGSMRRFDPIGIECVNCHQKNYQSTTKPNHLAAGYSTDCVQCHKAGSAGWVAENIEHGFFPLTGGHAISCTLCHVSGGYTKIPTDCYSCHKEDFNSTTAINHQQLNLSTNCIECHTTSPKWKPAKFAEHETRFFPVYSGSHANTWTNCTDCHNQTGNYTLFTCVDCHDHAKARMDDSHKETNGYQYNSIACFTCHPRGDKETGFNHAKTNFPLTGSHKTTDCSRCHANGFAGTATDCNSCHKAKFDQAQEPVHSTAGIPTQCEPCHNTTAWKPSTFNHTTTGFELIGGHSKVIQCSDCHKGTVVDTKADCISCHQVQYNGAKDHKTQAYPVNCKLCHNSDNWNNANFNHALTGFPLTGAHTTALCAKCHTNGYAGTPTDCSSCHTTNFTASQNPNHVAAGIPKLCETCHNTTAWKPSNFNHTTTGFALTGGHAVIAQCSQCHKGTVLNTRIDCISCHQVQYDGAKDHKDQAYPLDCKMCHNANNWLNASFNHSTTSFPLTGAHVTTLCSKCHVSGYTGTKTDCNSCHTTNFTVSQNPNHVAAGIPKLCETCHNTTAWKPSNFNHTTTGFALTGGHAVIAQCSQCHKGTVLNTRIDCISCHQVQYDGAKDHKAQAYPVNCKLCHNSDNWNNANFNHALTGFPLTGAHTTALCAKCHTNVYAGTPTDCNSCHTTNFTVSQNPNHVAAGIPKLCETCHNTTAWKPSAFSHTTTGFALTGGHAVIAQCSQCHKGTVLNTRTDCIACHQVQYDGAKDHKDQAYPLDCKMCHNANNWLNASFNHSTTSFPLTGAHVTTLCSKCHVSGYTGTKTDCNSCHTTNFTVSQNPNHVAAGIPKLCETCHNTTAWKPSNFNHTTTGFALTGGHAVVPQCSQCHKGTVLNTRTDCIACHQVQYDGAKDHKAQAYPLDCKMCHNANNWLNASFNHSTTSFPLTGVHVTTLCSKCHTTGYANTPNTCVACHQTNYNAATNPNHKSLGLAVTCSDCHTTNAGWTPATFTIHNNYWVLSGAHSAIATNCALCHKGNYTTTPNTCYGCHAAKYNATTNPNHVSAQFPKECESCHTMTAWTPSTWNHDAQYFRIYSGKHKGKWTLCTECHTTSTNFSTFSCINCHEHSNKASVDSQHQGKSGYSYTSAACFSCHPRI